MGYLTEHVFKNHIEGNPRTKSQFYDVNTARRCIVSTIEMTGKEIEQNRMLYEKTFSIAIGYTERNGKYKTLQKCRVIVNKSGHIVTAYPS